VACLLALALAGVRSRQASFGVLFGAAHFFMCGREVARLRRAFGRLPAPESLLFAGPKRRNQEKWPVEPADPTSPVGRGVGNRQDTSCSTGGHTAPSPSTEAREGVSRVVALRLLPPDRAVRSGLVYRLSHRYGCIARGRVPIGNPSRQGIGRTVVGAGAGRDPVAGAVGFRDDRPPTLLDSGLRRNDGEGGEPRGKHGAVRPRWSRRRATTSNTHSPASVNGDGAVWPSVEQEVSCLFPTPSSYKACRVGGLHRPFLLATSLWARKEK
jgi:hypothetical protein